MDDRGLFGSVSDRGRLIWPLIMALGLALFMGGVARAQVTLFGASSLTEIMEDLAGEFTARTGTEVTVVPGGSSVLAQQIIAGAPADIFISANRDWIDYVVTRRGFGAGTPLFGNQLVLIAPEGTSLQINSLADLGQVLGNARLAMGDPEHVPAGIYAREALQGAGIWSEIRPRIAPTENVRAALRLVIAGAAPLGIVYRTDARLTPVRTLLPIAPNLHSEITYIASLKPGASAGAAAFFEFLQGPDAEKIAAELGYVVGKDN